MIVTSWNCKVGRPDGVVMENLHDLILQTKPDVICLQEAGGYMDAIRKRYTKNWFIYGKKGWPESQFNPVMVWKKGRRKQTYNNGWGTVRTKKVWTGPQGGDHKGRTWTFVLVDGIWVMSFHRCTSGRDKNKDAFLEEADVVTTWVGTKQEPVLIIGDNNCGPKADFPGSSKRIAERVKGRTIFDTKDPGIDYAISRGVPGTVRHGKKYGSDHECAVFTGR